MTNKTDEQRASSLPLQEDAGAGVERTAKESQPPERELTVSELRAALDKAEKREMRNIAPLPVVTKTVTQVYGPDVETVTMVFPHPVTIVNKQHVKLRFEEGPQEVPVVDKDNWYLAANKVTFYKQSPTVEEWVDAGYLAENYPPEGHQSRSTQEEIDSAIEKQKQK